MRLQESKRNQAVKDCNKIKVLNLELMASDEKIKEKEKELKAKEERLRRLETKVMAMLCLLSESVSYDTVMFEHNIDHSHKLGQ